MILALHWLKGWSARAPEIVPNLRLTSQARLENGGIVFLEVWSEPIRRPARRDAPHPWLRRIRIAAGSDLSRVAVFAVIHWARLVVQASTDLHILGYPGLERLEIPREVALVASMDPDVLLWNLDIDGDIRSDRLPVRGGRS